MVFHGRFLQLITVGELSAWREQRHSFEDTMANGVGPRLPIVEPTLQMAAKEQKHQSALKSSKCVARVLADMHAHATDVVILKNQDPIHKNAK